MSEPTAEATIRTASLDDLDAIAAAELASFPAAEAATRESFAARLSIYPDHFWLLEVDGRLASFVNGMTTDEPVLRDEMYDDAALHNETGAWQMIFGVVTVPEFRRRGYAERLLRHVVEEARAQGRRGLVLTCKDHLVHYYAKFGFVDEGLSDSTHGGVAWHEMRLAFDEAQPGEGRDPQTGEASQLDETPQPGEGC